MTISLTRVLIEPRRIRFRRCVNLWLNRIVPLGLQYILGIRA